jgi:hypothetical protein
MYFFFKIDSILNVTDQQKYLMDSSVHGGTGTLCHSIEVNNNIHPFSVFSTIY